MALFSPSLSAMPQLDFFEPRPTAELKQAYLEISEDAAVSRLRPIQDILDYWQEHRVVRLQNQLAPRPD
jgi:hypothetical protein